MPHWVPAGSQVEVATVDARTRSTAPRRGVCSAAVTALIQPSSGRALPCAGMPEARTDASSRRKHQQEYFTGEVPARARRSGDGSGEY